MSGKEEVVVDPDTLLMALRRLDTPPAIPERLERIVEFLTLPARYESAVTELHQARTEMEAKDRAVHRLRDRVVALDDRLKEVDDRLKEVQAEFAGAAADLRQANTHAEELRGELATVRAERDGLRNELRAAHDRADDLKKRSRTAATHIEELQRTVAEQQPRRAGTARPGGTVPPPPTEAVLVRLPAWNGRVRTLPAALRPLWGELLRDAGGCSRVVIGLAEPPGRAGGLRAASAIAADIANALTAEEGSGIALPRVAFTDSAAELHDEPSRTVRLDITSRPAAQVGPEAPADIAPLPAPPERPFTTPPRRPPDDLQQILYIGPKLERMLNDQGITTFAQIAALDDQQVDLLQARLPHLPGKIRRDQWVQQARRLVGG